MRQRDSHMKLGLGNSTTRDRGMNLGREILNLVWQRSVPGWLKSRAWDTTAKRVEETREKQAVVLFTNAIVAHDVLSSIVQHP